MKRIYLLMAGMLLLGLTGCGAKDTKTELTTPEESEVSTEPTTQEDTEVSTVPTTQEDTEVSTESVTEATTTEAAQGEQTTGAITPEQAQELLVKVLGEKDEETGNLYSFGYENTMVVDGSEYYVFTWGWLVDDHVSHLTDLFVKTDGSAIYEGVFAGDDATVYTETNYLQ